jgi:sterol desaturase/sphingolipid hydroxylase (fatty acid hydroxylase superfamily)
MFPITLADWRAFDLFNLRVILPVLFSIALLEGLWLSRHQRYDWRAFAVSLADQVLRVIMGMTIAWGLFVPLTRWAHAHRLFTIEVDGVWALLGLFLGLELFYYAYHRGAHRIRWFWMQHVVHHSSNELNLGASYRIGLLGKIAGSAPFFLPLVGLGFHPRAVAGMLTLNLLYQYWLHNTWVPKLGPLEWVLNTPSAHRVHHAANVRYLDANYGGVLIIFDRLFGSYVAERADEPCRYGLVQPITHHNMLKIELGEATSLLRDLASSRGLREALGYLLGPPGWRPHGQGLTTEALRQAQSDPRALSNTCSLPAATQR